MSDSDDCFGLTPEQVDSMRETSHRFEDIAPNVRKWMTEHLPEIVAAGMDARVDRFGIIGPEYQLIVMVPRDKLMALMENHFGEAT